MSLGGARLDHYRDIYRDLVLHEAQQQGSRLAAVAMTEKMDGNKTFFDKRGKEAHYIKTSRNQAKTYSNPTYERRQVQEVLASYDEIFDKEDIIKYTSNPRSDSVQAAVWELGRRKDEVIIEAIRGNAVVTTDGSAANQALTLSVVKDSHTFDSGSGDVGLTSSKLKLAKTLMAENYGSQPNERLICIAPERQIMNLTTENQQVSGDFRSSRPLESPGVVQGISGFMGIDFISYEDTGTDASSDERVYLLTHDAIKLGIYLPLTVEIKEDTTLTTNPDTLAVYEAMGATRMYEQKVVDILCDPLA